MQVLILGAGASSPAGYPLTGELISAIEAFVRTEAELNLKANWNRWDSWRKSAQGVVRALLSNPNPEIVLSLPDLYEAALEFANCEQMRKAQAKWQAGELTEEDLSRYQDYWRSKEQRAQENGLCGFCAGTGAQR